MNDFKKGGFRKGGGDFGGRPKFGNKFGGERKFGGPGKFGGERKFGNKFGGPRGGDRPFGRPELFPATCSSCGKPCEVPFRPTGEKPVYCRDCFGKQEQAPWRESRGGDRNDRPQRDFRPQRESSGGTDGGNDELKRQLATLEMKVNRILEILSPKPVSTPAQKVVGESPKKEVEKPPFVASKKVIKEKKVKKAKK